MRNKVVGISNKAIEKATGKTWEKWFAVLDNADAQKMEHKEIVNYLHNKSQIHNKW